MKKGVLILSLLCLTISVNAISHYPSLKDNKHVRAARISKGIAIGTGATGLGLLMYTGARYVVKDAYWDDQTAYWNMQHENKFISDAEFDKQKNIISSGRDELRNETRRFCIISGGLFVVTTGLLINARYHKMQIGKKTTMNVTMNGFSIIHEF